MTLTAKGKEAMSKLSPESQSKVVKFLLKMKELGIKPADLKKHQQSKPPPADTHH